MHFTEQRRKWNSANNLSSSLADEKEKKSLRLINVMWPGKLLKKENTEKFLLFSTQKCALICVFKYLQ